MTDCPLCLITDTGAGPGIICQDDPTLAFLDIRPANSGHTLVVPRRHVPSFTDLAPAELEALWRMAQRVALALKATMSGFGGVTLSMAEGAAAGQEVPHAHLHVIPRQADDGFGWRRFGEKVDLRQMEPTASRIRGAIPYHCNRDT